MNTKLPEPEKNSLLVSLAKDLNSGKIDPRAFRHALTEMFPGEEDWDLECRLEKLIEQHNLSRRLLRKAGQALWNSRPSVAERFTREELFESAVKSAVADRPLNKLYADAMQSHGITPEEVEEEVKRRHERNRVLIQENSTNACAKLPPAVAAEVSLVEDFGVGKIGGSTFRSAFAAMHPQDHMANLVQRLEVLVEKHSLPLLLFSEALYTILLLKLAPTVEVSDLAQQPLTREQAFQVVVGQALVEDSWREIFAELVKKHGILTTDIEQEVTRRRKGAGAD